MHENHHLHHNHHQHQHNHNGEKHVHSGRSSESFIDAAAVLRQTGIGSGDIVLDIGCGEGHFSLAAAELVGEDGWVYAVDIFDQAIRSLQQIMEENNIRNIHPAVADATARMPVPDDTMNVVLMVNVLHGFVVNNELDSVMAEVVRAMKVGGNLIIIDFKKEANTPGPPVEIRLTPEDVAGLMKGFGFKKDRVYEAGLYNYALILLKE